MILKIQTLTYEEFSNSVIFKYFKYSFEDKFENWEYVQLFSFIALNVRTANVLHDAPDCKLRNNWFKNIKQLLDTII